MFVVLIPRQLATGDSEEQQCDLVTIDGVADCVSAAGQGFPRGPVEGAVAGRQESGRRPAPPKKCE